MISPIESLPRCRCHYAIDAADDDADAAPHYAITPPQPRTPTQEMRYAVTPFFSSFISQNSRIPVISQEGHGEPATSDISSVIEI
jgi:hypothetical protein